jgi:inhibitor of cysteine peptidase
MKTLLGILLLLISCVSAANEVLTLNVPTAQTQFVVTLPANPTTGFQWQVLDFDKELLTLSASTYQKNTSKLIGSGGQMLFTFTLNKGKVYPQQTKMTFSYSRQWESHSGTEQHVEVNFIVPSELK